MWNMIRNQTTSSNPAPKDVVESNDDGSGSSSKPLKKAPSVDNMNPKSINVKKRDDSLDGNTFDWFTNEKNEKKLSISSTTSSQDEKENFVIALIGKSFVGKSTIVRTGLSNLTPINSDIEQNGIKVPTMLTEIEVDDQAYPVKVLEIKEDIFNTKSPLIQLPEDFPEVHGILVCYDVTSRESISNIAWLLNAFKKFHIPTILAACKTDCDVSDRRVDVTYGSNLAHLFNIGFVELDSRSDAGIQKIRDVFSMLLRLIIMHKEKQKVHSIAESSSDSLYLQNISSDAESDKVSLTHRRTSSDLSYESRGRRRFSNLPAVRFMGRYSIQFGTQKIDSRKLRLNVLSSDEEEKTPPQTPQTNSVLSQASLPPAPLSSNKSEKNSNRRSILPSTLLQQVCEAEEEKDVSVRSINNRDSIASSNSTGSSSSERCESSLTWEDGFGFGLSRFPSHIDDVKCVGVDGMTTDDLIYRLTVGGQYGTHDDPFTIIFFVLYRTFMRPRDVLDKLMQKFRECEKGMKDSKDHRNTTHEKICNLLYNWIIQHPNDMIHPHTRIILRKFYDMIEKSPHLTYYSITLSSLVFGAVPEEDPDSFWGLSDVDDDEIAKNDPTKKDSGIGSWTLNITFDEDDKVSISQLCRPCHVNIRKDSLIVIKSTGRAAICQIPFEELPEKSIANELTYQEFQLFKKITPRDLLRHVWSPQGSSQREKGKVAQSIKHFNHISNWVATIILSQDKLKSRAAMLKKFMKVAIIVGESNNYNTLMAIIAAINSSPIARLRRTRDLVKGKTTDKFHHLTALMSTDKSFGNYRAALKTCIHVGQSGIPYLGIHLKDLVSIGEGNKDFQEDGRVHWKKFSLMGETINMIRSFQKRPYDIKNNKLIEKFIADTPVLDEEGRYNKSLDLEPRTQRSASASRVRR